MYCMFTLFVHEQGISRPSVYTAQGPRSRHRPPCAESGVAAPGDPKRFWRDGPASDGFLTAAGGWAPP